MYGFVPDIDEANSPPFSTVAMLKSVTCACPKQNINFIIAFIYLFNHFCIYYSQELFIITREKHLIIARFEFTKLSSSFFYPISRFFFFFSYLTPYPWIMIRIWLIVSWWSLCIICHMTQTMSHAWFSFENRISRYFLRSDFFAEFLCYLSITLSTRDEIWCFRVDEWKISINMHSGLIRVTLDFVFVIFVIMSFSLFSFLSYFFGYYRYH